MTFLQGLLEEGLLTPELMADVSTAASKKYKGDIDEALSKETNIPEDKLLDFKSKFF